MNSQRTNIKQEARQETTIRVSMQQVLDSQLLELGDDDLLMRIDNEINENGALEEGRDEHDDDYEELETDDSYDSPHNDTDDISYNVDSEELPVYVPGSSESQTEMPLGDTKSFIDELKEQLAEQELESAKQRELVEYLIASLDDNGFIDRPIGNIVDDLILYHNVDVDDAEMERALQVLQRLDPPGIGARNLKECMAIQLRRKIEESQEEGNEQRTKQLNMALDIVENYFDVFKRNDREQLMRVMKVDTEKIGKAIAEIVKLNPRPGLSLSESATGKAMAIEPDFIIETSVDGNISFTLRGGKIPELRVNPEYQEILNKTDATKLTPAQKEDYKYIKNNVERAQGFINAIHRRQETLARTMKAIIDAQRSFMISQDDADLKPLTGGEIAKRVGVDGSTISRAVSGRYALLDGTLYPLKDFFLRTKRNANGEEVLRTQVETAIAQMIDNEDKKKPLNDIQISDKLKSMGLNIQRRTVAKYRDQMNIPTASIRKKYK